MRSDLVVLTPELLDRDLRIDSILEPFHRKTFVPELSVERFVGEVLSRPARIDVRGVDLELWEPFQHSSRNKLWTIVRPPMLEQL
jgi:hypothetical protein